MTRYLLISICLFVFGCGSFPKKQGFTKTNSSESIVENNYFSNENTDYVYKAQITVYDQHFGGLLIVKKIQENSHRVVFTTEMGTKLFDFSFIENDFRVNYIVDDFDKGLLIKILKQDFKTLITENLNNNSQYKIGSQTIFETSLYNKKHFYYFDNDTLVEINRIKGAKEKVSFQFSNISDSIAKQIDIIHYNIKLKITLKSIN